MTQIVSISAVTAAYAAEALRPNARVSGMVPLDPPTKTVSGKQRKVNEGEVTGSVAPVPSAALSMFLLTNSMNNRQPETAYQQAEDAYIDNNGDDMNALVEAAPGDDDQEVADDIAADVLADLIAEHDAR